MYASGAALGSAYDALLANCCETDCEGVNQTKWSAEVQIKKVGRLFAVREAKFGVVVIFVFRLAAGFD